MRRAIKDLSQLSDKDLFYTVADGLKLITKNAWRLYEGSVALAELRNFHASRVLRAIAEEESTKFLILMDAVRCPRLQGERFSKHLGRFYDHLAKGLYAKACMMSPMTLRQLQEYLDPYRHQLYLDGPNDVDWIFGNEIIHGREGLFYVDYVSTDEGRRWADPLYGEELFHSHPTQPFSVKIAKSLFDVRAGSAEALAIVAEVWRSTSIHQDMTCTELRLLNKRTLERLESRNVLREQPTETYAYVIHEWQFPMYDLELGQISVDQEALRAEQLNSIHDNF